LARGGCEQPRKGRPYNAAALTPSRRTAFLIGLFCFAIYNANGRAIPAGDTYPARYLPFAVLRYGTVFLNPVANVAAQGRGDGAFWLLHRPGGRIMSLYPITEPLLVTPLYVPAVTYLRLTGWSGMRLDYIAKVMEKLTASLLAALSASLLYLLLRRRTTQSIALVLTAAYAFGTTTWVVSSQALWQHTIAGVLVIAAMLLLTAPFTVRRAVGVALLCGVIACNRPPDIVLAAALGAYALLWAGRRYALLLAAVAALPMLVVLFYNVRFGGNVAGGYGVIGGVRFFNHPLLPGIAGILISPARGLFVYSPFLLFLALAFAHRPRNDDRRLTIALIAGVAAQIALYAKADWRSGLSWGPRYMTDLLPFLMWMLLPVVERLRPAARLAFLAATAIAIAIEAIGAFCYSGGVDLPIYAKDMHAVWKLRNASFIGSLRAGISPPLLWRPTHGSFDALTSPAPHPQELVAEGWTLIGHRTPVQVAMMIDGHPAAATSTFTDRRDVRAALGETSPSGWRIPIDTSTLSPGEHQLTTMVWASWQEEPRYLGERTVVVWGGGRGWPRAMTLQPALPADVVRGRDEL
jgi:hypothetical protein